jgi:uncharacterized protein YjbJ (UPF0337 family)
MNVVRFGPLGSSADHNATQSTAPHVGGSVIGAKTDQIFGRAKQALGAITGGRRLKRKGRLQEHNGELKGKFDSAVDQTQDWVVVSRAMRTLRVRRAEHRTCTIP